MSKQSEWIDIKDDYPKLGQWFIGYNYDGRYSAQFPYRLAQMHEQLQEFVDSGEFVFTHWFKLPSTENIDNEK